MTISKAIRFVLAAFHPTVSTEDKSKHVNYTFLKNS